MDLAIGTLFRSKRWPNRLVQVVAVRQMLTFVGRGSSRAMKKRPCVWYRQFSVNANGVTKLGPERVTERGRFFQHYTPASCLQCGQAFNARACGPSHAIVENARRVAA